MRGGVCQSQEWMVFQADDAGDEGGLNSNAAMDDGRDQSHDRLLTGPASHESGTSIRKEPSNQTAEEPPHRCDARSNGCSSLDSIAVESSEQTLLLSEPITTEG
jgi:hypothetical protein